MKKMLILVFCSFVVCGNLVCMSKSEGEGEDISTIYFLRYSKLDGGCIEKTIGSLSDLEILSNTLKIEGKCVKELNLSNLGLCAYDVAFLAKYIGLQLFTNLESINISNNKKLKFVELKMLFNGIAKKDLPKFKCLDISDNNIAEKKLEELKLYFLGIWPELKIIS